MSWLNTMIWKVGTGLPRLSSAQSTSMYSPMVVTAGLGFAVPSTPVQKFGNVLSCGFGE